MFGLNLIPFSKVLKKTYYLSWFLVADFAGAFAAWLTFFSLRKIVLGESPESVFQVKVLLTACGIAVFWVVLYLLFGFYKELYRRSRLKDGLNLIVTNMTGVVIVFFTLLLDDAGVYMYVVYYKTLALYFFTHYFFILINRVFVISIIRNLIRKGQIVFNTVIIGSDKNAFDIYKEASGNPDLGFRFIGFLHVNELATSQFGDKLRNFGSYNNLNKLIRRTYIDQVIIAIETSEHKIIQDILNKLEGANVKIGIVPDMYQLLLGSVKANQLLDIPLIEINPEIIPQWQQILKRTFDIVFSISVLMLGLPIFVVIGLLTRFSSPGPVFYSQERIGQNSKPFKIIKFRSMYLDSESGGPALASDIDKRITPWGKIMRKYRIDELPQFYNVLVGDMAIVGPRPERQFFIDQILEFAPEYKHLQKVRPGLTSLGQVKFGYAENVEEMVKRLKYDIFYIENLSISMDLKIIFYTIAIIIQGRGK
jgi:exopolysaccharide biosynthesis polyprenyl glycosylphosphotransferase